MVRLRENPDNDRVFLEDDESDWKTVMWWNNKVSYIKSKNSEEKFNPTIEDGQVTHAMRRKRRRESRSTHTVSSPEEEEKKIFKILQEDAQDMLRSSSTLTKQISLKAVIS